MDLNERLMQPQTWLHIEPIYKPHPKTGLPVFEHFVGMLHVKGECVLNVEGDSVEEVIAELNSVIEADIWRV